MRCFILAGGFATRLWPLTEKRAKPLLPLAGKPILTYLIEKIPADLPITVSTNAAFKDGFDEWKKTIRRNIEILIEDAHKDDQKLGALGAVAKWIHEHHINDDVLLITGDNYCGFLLSDFVRAFHGTTLIAGYNIKNTERAKQFGTILTNQNKSLLSPPLNPRTQPGGVITVTGFEEKPAKPQTTLVNTGFSILPRHTLLILTTFAASHPDNVGGIFEELLQKNEKIGCFRFAEPWFDIGSFESYLEATNSLVGNKVIDHGSLSFDSKTKGAVVIGKGSTVTKSDLHNVVLFENCHITDCVLKDCIIDNNCTLSHIDLDHKMIREGTVLERK